ASEAVRNLDLNQFTNRIISNSEGPQPVLGDPTPESTFTNPLPNLQDYQGDILFQRGVFQSHSLSVQGKSDQTNYAISAQRLQDKGIFQGFDGYTRNAFRVNADHLVSQKLELQLSSMYSFSKQDLLESSPNSYFANALLLTPIFDLTSANEENGQAFDWDIDNTGYGINNPLYDRTNSHQTVNRTRLMGNFIANFYANEWLTFSYSAALDRATNDFEHFVEKDYLSTNIPGLFGTQVTAGLQNSAGGGIQRSNRQSDYFTSRADAVFRRSFGGFNTALRASFLYEDLNTRFNDVIGENLSIAGIRSLDNARSNIFISSEQQDIIGYSGFLIGDADYKQKFIFSGLIRREGTSLFGPENRWAHYYRASGAYRLTEDINLKWIQELKLRASMGTSGIRPNFEQRFETFELINGVTTKNTLGNEFLKPAYSTETEIGLDMTFLKAFTLEFNYSQITTEDQILLVPLTGAAGFRGQWRNAGTIESKVYEAGLNIDIKRLFRVKIPDFRWDVYTTFDRVEQTISKLDVPSYVTGPGIQGSSLFLIEEGQPFGTMVGEVFATNLNQLKDLESVNPDDYTINPAGYVVQKDQLGTPQERPYKLRDANGNPLVQPIGNINPDFRMGFAHYLGYKGFQIYTLFDWKKGGDIYNLTKQWLYRDFRHGDMSKYPDIAAGFYSSEGLYNGLVTNNHFVEDGSFFMLREASISYHVKLNNFFENIKLSLIGRNLFTNTKYSGFHPDVTSAPRDENTLSNRFDNGRGSDLRTPGGDPSVFFVDAFNYPLARTYTFSVQITF
ncbi:MAG: TonB-dependent receptor, partial [Saprospiraceae bacterium]|nr:TonB-dependent receptor [Saprospiraceae bacterium]